MMRGIILFILFAVAALIVIVSLPSKDELPDESSTPLTRALSGSATGWQRAEQIREFHFPADHGPHLGFKTEWWYFTGNLQSDNGQRFGYQLTLFRIGMKPGVPDQNHSAWRANHFYMGHFAVTDENQKQFYRFERFARAGNQLAGATTQPLRIWLEDWQIKSEGENVFPLHLYAKSGVVELDIRLTTSRAPVLQGDHGLSRKSNEVGNASYYYSYTRMPTDGAISIDNRIYNVHGNSWWDREWSTSALGADQSGWDWFAIQLDDGRDIMFYRLRKRDGSIDENSAGIIVGPNEQTKTLTSDDVKLTPVQFWQSEKTRIRYPTRWQLEIPSQLLHLNIVPLIDNQEMDLTIRYWEGAVVVSDFASPHRASGRGYIELAGYEKP